MYIQSILYLKLLVKKRRWSFTYKAKDIIDSSFATKYKIFNTLTNVLIYEKDVSFVPYLLGQLILEIDLTIDDVELPSYWWIFRDRW